MVSLYPDARMVRVADGATTASLCTVTLPAVGVDAGKRILLLHGNPSHLDHWSTLAPALQRLAHILAYDEPGFGRSEPRSGGPPSLERSARTALALLDALAWDDPVDVVGHSHGGMVALALASLAPQRVGRVVVLATGGTPAHPAYRALAVPGVGWALRGSATRVFRAPVPAAWLSALVRASARAAFHPDAVPENVVQDEVLLLARPPEILWHMARLAAVGPCARVAHHAAQVSSPVLFVHGSEDALVPIAYACRLFGILHRASPASQFLAIPGGHMLHVTRAAAVAAQLERWLKEIG